MDYHVGDTLCRFFADRTFRSPVVEIDGSARRVIADDQAVLADVLQLCSRAKGRGR